MRQVLTWIAGVLALVMMLAGVPVYAGAAPVQTFKDVTPTHWAYSVIEEAASKGLISGFPGGTFRPNDPVTAAQFMRMMFMSLAEKQDNGKFWWAQKYLDMVPEWSQRWFNDASITFEPGKPWYATYLQNAKTLGIVGNRTYDDRMDAALTRESAAVMVMNLDGWLESNVYESYAKVAGPQLFKDYSQVLDEFTQWKVTAAALRGIMVGNNGYFNPKGKVTRAEAAQIVATLADKTKRSRVSAINLDGIPYSVVPEIGYTENIIVFTNDEMKKVHDTMVAKLAEYKGSTERDGDRLSYYENEDAREKQFYRDRNLDIYDPDHYFDFSVGFNGSNYNVVLSYENGRAERASKPLNDMLTMLYKDPEPVKKLFSTSIAAAREGSSVELKKTFENRDILIYSTGRGWFQISIGAYGDKLP